MSIYAWKRVPGYELLDLTPLSPQERAKINTIEVSGHEVALLLAAINVYLGPHREGKPTSSEFSDLSRLYDVLADTNRTGQNRVGKR